MFLHYEAQIMTIADFLIVSLLWALLSGLVGLVWVKIYANLKDIKNGN
jgi:hypothetical protein